jgi:hypothetical protein
MCEKNITPLIRIVWFGAIMALSFCLAPGLAATISRSSDIEAAVAAIRSMTGPSSAAASWLARFAIRAARPIFAPL